MKRHWIGLGTLTAALLLGSHSPSAHEGHEHILTLKDVVDAQAAREWPKVYANLRAAASHMAMIADPLDMAITKQFPARFAHR